MRKAYPILAVAITTSACSSGVGEPSQDTSRQQLAEELARTTLADALAQKDHFLPLCDANGYPLVGNMNGKAVTTVAEFCEAARTPATTPTTPTPPKPACPVQLNEQLGNITLDAALEQYQTFRPICDADGYPLCGNLNGKVITRASEFCQALRDKNLE